MAPPVPLPSATTALFARTCPGAKLIVLASGNGWSSAESRSEPTADGWTTVTLTESALAVGGTPHLPASATARSADGPSAGPPPAPGGRRVSSRRQGARV